MLSKLSGGAVLLITVLGVAGTLYVTWVYVWPWFISAAAGDEIARIVREVVKQECLK